MTLTQFNPLQIEIRKELMMGRAASASDDASGLLWNKHHRGVVKDGRCISPIFFVILSPTKRVPVSQRGCSLPEMPVSGHQNIACQGNIGNRMCNDTGEKVFSIDPEKRHEQTKSYGCGPFCDKMTGSKGCGRDSNSNP